ncbi:MAG: 2-hydroxyacyl-CoA dehydratase [Firmicutes bacterium]|nr:2-hydroxyacyl-CoA dehydratase [Bacillota bacterium]
MSEIRKNLDELKRIAESPRAQLDRVLSEGKKAIGVIPYFAPEELVYAAGMVPFGMWGAETQVTESKRYYPAFYCSILHTALDLGIKGEFRGLSAVMIPLTCDSLKGMGTNWRFGVKDIPVIDVAYAQNRTIPAGEEFTESQFKKIRGQVEEIAGCKISDKALSEANRVYNANRKECLRFTELAASHARIVSLTDRALALKARYFMERDAHTELLRKVNDELAAMPAEQVKGKKIVTTGIIADSPELLSILQESGFVIAADQITHESVDFRALADETIDPVKALARRLNDIKGSSVLYDPAKGRNTELAQIAKACGADGVLWVLTKFCDPEEFDYVPAKEMLDAAGIPMLQIEIDQQMVNYEQVRTAIETFKDIL